MAERGWILIRADGWKYSFKAGKPKFREYFIYSSFDARNEMAYDYYQAKSRYGRKSAELNKTIASVFEVDEAKINEEYYRTRKLRNKIYMSHYKKVFTLAVFLSILALVVLFYEAKTALLLLYPGGLLAYAAASMIILKHAKNE